MHELKLDERLGKGERYRQLSAQLHSLFAGERSGVANAANLAAALFHSLADLNWAGFYFRLGDDLVLGPFQGKVACVRIPIGRGVCGTAAERGTTLIVPDVQAFAGHIACDAASQSEIVVPLKREGRVIGVLDLDSPFKARFDEEDGQGLEALAALLVTRSDFSRLVD